MQTLRQTLRKRFLCLICELVRVVFEIYHMQVSEISQNKLRYKFFVERRPPTKIHKMVILHYHELLRAIFCFFYFSFLFISFELTLYFVLISYSKHDNLPPGLAIISHAQIPTITPGKIQLRPINHFKGLNFPKSSGRFRKIIR